MKKHFAIISFFWVTLFTCSSYAKNKRETFLLIGVQNPRQQLEFATLDQNDNKTQDFLLDPNPKGNLTLGIHHRDISLFVGLPILDENPDVDGESEVTDLRFKGKFGEFLPRLYYQKYKGFELKDQLANNRSLGFLSQVETLHYGLGGFYFFKDDYISYHSGQKFLELLKDKGLREDRFDYSYLVSVGYDFLKISGLPASSISSSFSSLNGSSEFQTLTMSGGANLRYFWDSVVIEGTFSVGPGHTWYKAQTGVRKSQVTINGNIELLLGYHFLSSYFFLLNFDGHFISGDIDGADLTNSINSAALTFGKSF